MNSGLTVFILFYYFRDNALPSFGLNSFIWEINQQSDDFFLLGNVSFFSCYFKDLHLYLGFLQFDCDEPWWGLFYGYSAGILLVTTYPYIFVSSNLVITSSNVFSLPFSTPSLYGIPFAHILDSLILSIRSLRLIFVLLLLFFNIFSIIPFG